MRSSPVTQVAAAAQAQAQADALSGHVDRGAPERGDGGSQVGLLGLEGTAGRHHVSLDNAINTMRETGADMSL